MRSFGTFVVGGTDNEDSDFEGCAEADVVRIDPADAESDLDIDFEAVEDGLDAEDSDSDNDGSNVDLLQHPRGDWSTHLHHVYPPHPSPIYFLCIF